MAPLVYRDMLLVGLGGGDLGIRGSLVALSASNGKVRWRWFATDAQHWFGFSKRLRTDTGYLKGAASANTRRKFADSWIRGGGGIWTTPAVDPRRNTVYLTTGNPWPDLDGSGRPGDNLFTDCIVALDASTGRMKWYFQQVAHDTMDLDAASPPVLFRVEDDHGDRTDALGEIGKTGLFYILNRDTGGAIRISENVSSVALSRERNAQPKQWTGGASWSPMSFDPRSGLVIVTTTRHLMPEPGKRGIAELEREWQTIYSSVSAINVDSGAIVWQDQFDGGLVGGTTTTAGGITFVGEGNGYFDALDTKTGARLWHFQTGAGVNAPPVVFAENGHEYVSVASGGNQQLGTAVGDALITFGIKDR
jgi:glucose dehydrogenase